MLKRKDNKFKKIHNIWIVKPGEYTNRGNGIELCDNLQDIETIIKSKEIRANGK